MFLHPGLGPGEFLGLRQGKLFVLLWQSCPFISNKGAGNLLSGLRCHNSMVSGHQVILTFYFHEQGIA